MYPLLKGTPRVPIWGTAKHLLKSPLFYYFLRLFIYLFMRDTQRRQRHRQREKQALCREPYVGLDPGTPESRPEPKAAGQPLRPPGISLRTYLEQQEENYENKFT